MATIPTMLAIGGLLSVLVAMNGWCPLYVPVLLLALAQVATTLTTATDATMERPTLTALRKDRH